MRMKQRMALGLLLALSLAGCGGGGNDGDGVATAGGSGASATANAGRPGSGNEREPLLKFSQCMRDNGVPNFPDPEFNEGGGTNISAPQGTDPQKVDAAQAKCKQYLPNGGEPQKIDPAVVEQLRKYSQCMRDNGIPNFPDPTDGGLQINNDQLGLAPNDPKMQKAEEACRSQLPAPRPGDSPATQSRGDG